MTASPSATAAAHLGWYPLPHPHLCQHRPPPLEYTQADIPLPIHAAGVDLLIIQHDGDDAAQRREGVGRQGVEVGQVQEGEGPVGYDGGQADAVQDEDALDGVRGRGGEGFRGHEVELVGLRRERSERGECGEQGKHGKEITSR